ncbi:MAG: antibiotic biosynthesis monooxygenase [Eudoraea sp.]|nr:antibiotic biosynthesis monooxygenase [Eudoraea sp.]
MGLSNCETNKENELLDRISKLENEGQLVVQIAELVIDPNKLEAYTVLLQEGIKASVEIEPGVLSLYAMADKEQPNKITVVEIYAGMAAYESHITSPHFLKYKNGTLAMVESLVLTRTIPIIFAAKSN